MDSAWKDVELEDTNTERLEELKYRHIESPASVNQAYGFGSEF